MIIVQGDNGTVINEVFKKNGVAVDLTGATVQVYVKIGESMYTKNVTITDAINGLYDLTLNSNDVGITGLYYYQAYATFTSGKRISSDIDRFIVTKRLDGIPVDPGVPGDGGTVGEVNPDLLRIGISSNGKLTIDGVEQSGGGSGTGLLSYATLADLQSAYPGGSAQPVWVVAENSWYYWEGEITEPTTDTTAPNNVTNLSTSNVAQTTLTLSWTASTSSDIASYEVYRGSTLLTTVTGTTYNVTGLVASTAYTFTVKAKDTTGNVSAGVQTSATTLDEPVPGDTTAPNNVTNLQATNVSATGVTLTWTASTSTDVANYQVYKDGVNIGQASGTEFIVSGLTASTAYVFTVKAKDTSANEASGVTVNVTTSAPADTTAPVLTITPAATFTDTQQVTMSTNETATIYYTTDGSTPTTSSSVYSTALTLSATTTVKAFARDTAGNSSAVQTVVYTKQASEPSSGVISDNLLLWYDGRDGTATTNSWNDRSSNNNDGSLNTYFTYDTNSGWTGSGLKFKATQGTVVTTGKNITSPNYTIESYFQFDAVPSSNNDSVITQRKTGLCNGFAIAHSTDTNRNLFFRRLKPTVVTNFQLLTNYVVGQKYHVVVTCEQIDANNTRYIGYVDGVEVFNQTDAFSSLMDNTLFIAVGGMSAGGYAPNMTMFTQRVYNRKLTSTEVTSNYNEELAIVR